MMQLRIVAAPIAILVTLATVLLSAAADDPVSRTELRRADLTGAPGTEVVVTRLIAQPGAMIPRHTHPGDEFVYVIVGGAIGAEGGEPMALAAGDTLHFPRDQVHGGFTVMSATAIEVVTVHIVDKGVPMTVLVSEE